MESPFVGAIRHPKSACSRFVPRVTAVRAATHLVADRRCARTPCAYGPCPRTRHCERSFRSVRFLPVREEEPFPRAAARHPRFVWQHQRPYYGRCRRRGQGGERTGLRRELASRISGTEFIILPGVGHLYLWKRRANLRPPSQRRSRRCDSTADKILLPALSGVRLPRAICQELLTDPGE
jgi:hypothetical protein